MSTEDLQQIIEVLQPELIKSQQKATKTKSSWYMAIIITILISSGGVIFSVGVYKGALDLFVSDIKEWKKDVNLILTSHEIKITTLEAEKKQREIDKKK